MKKVRRRKTNTIWDHLYVESKIQHKWTYIQNRHRKETYDCQGGWRERIGHLELVDANTYRMWELAYNESWVLKNWFLTVVLEKTLESPLDSKEIEPVHPKENQSWIFIGKSDAEAETPILWPLDPRNWLTGKDPDTEKDWRLQEKGTPEDEMVGRHRWLNGHEFESTPGVGDKQPCLACWSPCSCKKSDRTEWLNWLIEWVSSEWPNAMF